MGEDFDNCGVCGDITSDYRCGGNCNIWKSYEHLLDECGALICKECYYYIDVKACDKCIKIIELAEENKNKTVI